MEHEREVRYSIIGYLIGINGGFLVVVSYIMSVMMFTIEASLLNVLIKACMAVLMALVCFIISMVFLGKEIKQCKDGIIFGKKLNKISIIVKLGTIPFFIVNFLTSTILAGACGNPFLFALIPFVIIVGVTVAVTVLITTSSYTIMTYIMAKKYQVISKKSCIILIITQCIFVVDIIGAIIGSIIIKKGKYDVRCE